jgi:hypothetical protein
MIKFYQNSSVQKGERGAILVFSLIIMSLMISITFTVMGIFIPKLKIASDPIKSVIAYSVAENGLEWCLYVQRDNPLPPPLPSAITLNGDVASVVVYYPASGFTTATCSSASEPSMNHRAVGSYQGVARSFEIIIPLCSNGLDDDSDTLYDLSDPQCADSADNDEAN